MKFTRIHNELNHFEKINCPLCNFDKGWNVYDSDNGLKDFKIWCSNCGLIYQQQTWSNDDSNKFYGKYYLQDYLITHLKYKNIEPQESHYLHQVNSRDRRMEVELIRQILSDSNNPIEVGTSSGGVLKMLSDVNSKIFGIDIDESAVRFATSKGLNVKCWDISKIEDKYDFIWTSHVLEHVKSISWFLKQIDNIATDDAYFIFIVPNSLAMPEGPHVPHIFNFGRRQAIQVVENNTSFRLEKEFNEVKNDLFLVFKKSKILKDKMYPEFYTTHEEYLQHVKNLRPVFLGRARNDYDSALSKKERQEAKAEYKSHMYKGRPISKWLLWSKLYVFFTLKIFTKR